MEETRADESLPWVVQRVRQPPNQLRLFVGYGPSERLRLLVGHAFDYLNKMNSRETRRGTHYYYI